MSPRYLLDINICIYMINQRPQAVLRHFDRLQTGEVTISSITRAELNFGVAKRDSERNRSALEKFLLPLETLAFDESASRAYGDLRAALEREGAPIGALDTLIAAHALALDLVLVTNNTREFERVPGLALENPVSA